MRRLSVRAALSCLLPAVLAAAVAAGCSKQDSAPPAPVVKKTVPAAVAKAQEGTKPGATADNAAKPAAEPIYSPQGRRDPFLPFFKEEPRVAARALPVPDDSPPLQRYEVAEFRLVGVVWGRRGYKALIEDREGKGYTVSVGMKVGRGGGTVARITDKELVVRERFSDDRGKALERETVLKLQSAGGK